MATINRTLPLAGGEQTVRPSSTRTMILRVLTVLALIGLAITLYMSLVWVGADATQGDVQRIFYTHVATFSGAAVAFSATVIGGILYLRTRNPKWDTLALAGVEVGFTLSLITTVTGSIWSRPTWNTWWTWDPRLTSITIMVLTYAAYLMLRSAIESGEKRRAIASVYGILAMGTVIFTFMVIRIRPDTIHPAVIGTESASAQGGFAMSDSMRTTLAVASMVWSVLLAPTLMWWRIRLENLKDYAERLRVQTYES
ncbi:MAG: cytochrome c biogenesis protein CcsA [Anaerolineae bacterium]|nr:cytochrome c biogenesis protein CcsA [Anaerolineae bacterium]